MPRLHALLVALSIGASAVHAQGPSGGEVGIVFGLSVLRDRGISVTMVGLPSAGALGSLYGARIMHPWIVEFHFSLNQVSDDETKVTQRYLAVQADYLLLRKTACGPYLFANVGEVWLSGDLRARERMAGAGVGYRLPFDDRFAGRLEARYRRWFDSTLHEYGLLVGAGVRF